MITAKITTKSFWDNETEAYVFFMKEKLACASDLQTLSKIEKAYYPHIKDILKKHKFEGKKDQFFMVTAPHKNSLIEFIFIGIGEGAKSWNVELETLRRAIGQLIIELKKKDIKSALLALPEENLYKISRIELLKQLVITAHMASYEFTTYRKVPKEKSEWKANVFFEVRSNEEKELSEALHQGTVIGKAINQARHWGDMPPNILTPGLLSSEAEIIAKEQKLTCTVFGEEKAAQLNMGAFLSVAKGSDHEGKFVILEYHTKEKNAPTLALAGKGVTFDTGGISLKPSSGMAGMKYDMSGAAAVIAIMNIIGQLKPNINVIGLTPLVENMPSGKASRQDDVVTAMNGKTIEIKSTDAEGRLILSDTLCYAEEFYKPDIIIDIATLTGACVYALGYFYSGLMTQDAQLQEVLSRIGQLTGDRVWPLPLDDDYKPANKSDVADVANSGSSIYKAGTITAACFLQEFVEKSRWAHIDIAGTADSVPGINYLGKGSAGASIRLLVEFIMSYHRYLA